VPNKADAALLNRVALRTLEEAAFIFADTAPRGHPWNGKTIEVRIQFRGPETGMLRVRTTPDFGRAVAANLLGLEPEDEEVEINGPKAVAELLNILAGTLLAEIFTTKVVCHLGIPELGPHAALTQSTPQAWVGLIADDVFPIELDLFFEPSR
jgi:hypothetical protein